MTTELKKPGRSPDARMVGTFTIDTPPPPVNFTYVDALLFNSDGTNTTGGYLQGSSRPFKAGRADNSEIYLGFPAARAGTGNLQTFQYPSDFHEPYLRWIYINQEGKRHAVGTGTITIEFGNNFSFIKGTYSFVDTEGTTFSGSFDIRYI